MTPIRKTRRIAPKPIPIQAFALLFVVSGATDALIYRHSRDLLAVYMTGNTSHVGQHLAMGDWAGVMPLLAVIGAFFGATTLAAWLGDRTDQWRATLVMLLTALLIALAFSHAVAAGYTLVTVVAIAAAMGTLNQVSAKESGVTFLTGALVRTGRALAAGQWRACLDGLLRWVALITGAAIATVLDDRYGSHSLLFVVAALVCGALLTTWNAVAHRQATRETPLAE
ncbi:YoaK family protein [Salinicola sp. V024]|uniref:YoaK family protein n=1 Tax=Salinicola sp. V024 TaxID=3459609 RepID=UPI004043992D